MKALEGPRWNLADLVAKRERFLATSTALGGSGLIPLPRWVADSATDLVAPVIGFDIDGDGLGEMITARASRSDTLEGFIQQASASPTGLVLEARRGTDGVVLWSVPVAGGYLYVGDVDEDGRDDLLLLEEVSVWAPILAFPALPRVDAIGTGQSVRLLDPSDGRTRWTIPLPSAEIEAVQSDDGWRSTYLITGGVVSLSLIPDVDGDGRNDLFVGTLDVIGESRYGADGYGSSSRSTFTGRVFRGVDGAPAGALTARGEQEFSCGDEACDQRGGLAWIVPSGDVSGDGRGDAVTVSFDLDGGMLRARTLLGQDRWSSPLGSGSAFPLTPDLDGDGVRDVLLFGTADSPYEWWEALSARDGVSGERRWITDRPVWIWAIAGDADHDGGADLMALHYGDGEATMISGATATEIWDVYLTYDEPDRWDSGSLQYCLCPDFDDDGIRDLLIFGRFWRRSKVVDARLTAFRGSDGAEMWRSGSLGPALEIVTFIYGEAARDPADLVLGWRLDEHRATHRLDVRSVDGATFSSLVAGSAPLSSAAFDNYSAELIAATTNADGSGTDELAVGVIEWGFKDDSFDVFESVRTYAYGKAGLLWSAP